MKSRKNVILNWLCSTSNLFRIMCVILSKSLGKSSSLRLSSLKSSVLRLRERCELGMRSSLKKVGLAKILKMGLWMKYLKRLDDLNAS